MRLAITLPMAALAFLGCVGAAAGADRPQWIRYPAIAPDGSQIAFSYRGQIFTVPAQGGQARALTGHGHYSYAPVWSPDSREIAFASDINGDDDVFVTDGTAGGVRRLTWTSRPEAPVSFAPDGGTVLFTSAGLGDSAATMQGAINGKPHLHQVGIDGTGRRLVLPNQVQDASWSPDGRRLLYSYDPSFDPSTRQHRVASNARQIWVFDAAAGRHERLFETAHDATGPVWAADGASVYYLGEQSGTLNVWAYDLARGSSRQLTFHDEFPVRHLSAARDGTVSYVHAGQLYLLAPGANQPRRIDVSFSERDMGQPQRVRGFQASEFVTSPDGAYVAVVSGAEIVLIDRQGGTRQLTDTPDPEKDVAFSPDSTLLAYAAQRDGVWGIYGVELQREDAGQALALTYREQPLVIGDDNAFQPKFSPDGSKLGYVFARREIRVLDLETGETYTPFTPQDYNTSYGDGDLWFDWSPDSRSIVSSWKSVPFAVAERAGIMPADASGPIHPVTTSMPEIREAFFSGDGTQILALTQHYGLRTSDQSGQGSDYYRVFLSDEARADFLDAAEGRLAGAEDGDEVEEDDRPDGYAFQPERKPFLEGRLTTQSAHHLTHARLPDSPHILTVAVDLAQTDISVLAVDLRDGSMTELASVTDLSPEAISIAPQARLIDLKTAEGIVTLPIDNPAERSFMAVSLEQDIDGASRRRAAFDQVWADIKFKYYRSDVEGRDWERIGAHYREYLPSIASERELVDLVDEMFGEISASHLFVRYRPDAASRKPGTSTASLGLFIDPSYPGPGIRIAEILDGGPLDRESFDIEAGDIVTSIDGRPLPEAGGLHRALDGLAGRAVQVGFIREGDGVETMIAVRPISLAAENALAYQRWVHTRRQQVAARSRQCVVYEHIPAMDNDSYVAAYGRIISARGTARAALVDVRSNLGGNLHRQLINLLSGAPFAEVGKEERQRDVEPLDRWIGPSAVVIDTFAYSDGSVFPMAYRDAGVGMLVGDRLLNTGTGVNYIDSLVAPGLNYGIPVQPFRRLDGTYYENLEIEPDLLVPYDPNALNRGEDPKLDAAVDALMGKIGADADCR